jgi:hypothetical protein
VLVVREGSGWVNESVTTAIGDAQDQAPAGTASRSVAPYQLNP